MSFTVPGQTPRSRALWVTARSPHYVYRCYDADDLLLYVGCTSDLRKRMAAHRRGDGKSASRWLKVCMVRHEVSGPYPDRESGLKIESAAILSELPVFNQQWASRTAGGLRQQSRIAHYLVDHGHLNLAVETCCTCWGETKEVGAYDSWCVAHVAQPGGRLYRLSDFEEFVA